MNKLVAFLRGVPALIAGAVQTVLGLVMGLGVALSARKTGSIEAAVTAAGPWSLFATASSRRNTR